MFYYLFEYLKTEFNLPGAGVFQYISFRAAMAVLSALLISMVYGKKIIKILHENQVGETVRDLGLEGQVQKQGTPTMGGLIIIAAILIPALLFTRPDNVYVVIKEKVVAQQKTLQETEIVENYVSPAEHAIWVESKSTKTTIPFFK